MGAVWSVFTIALLHLAVVFDFHVETLREHTGEPFWPLDPVVSFKWHMFFSRPWVALILGCLVGVPMGLWNANRLGMPRDEWIRLRIEHMKGVRIREDYWHSFKALAFGLAFGVSMFLVSGYLHVAGAIYGNAAIAISMFVSYPQRKALDLEVSRKLESVEFSDVELVNVRGWQAKQEREAKRMWFVALMFVIFSIAGAFYFSGVIVDALAGAEEIILQRQLGN